MAVNYSSDLILDAIGAANPARARAAEERLTRLTDGASAPAAFAAELDNSKTISQAAERTSSDAASHAPVKPIPLKSPFQKFEASALQTFIENMMPPASESVFGSGFAGGVWKSFLAEMLASAASGRGGIGIAALAEKSAAATQKKVPFQQEG